MATEEHVQGADPDVAFSEKQCLLRLCLPRRGRLKATLRDLQRKSEVSRRWIRFQKHADVELIGCRYVDQAPVRAAIHGRVLVSPRLIILTSVRKVFGRRPDAICKTTEARRNRESRAECASIAVARLQMRDCTHSAWDTLPQEQSS